MSLVGSLEDLSLGDILQIISLSQKSGVLVLEATGSDGRIVFVNGLVRGAAVKGGPQDLRGVLVGGGFLSGEEFDAGVEHAHARGEDVAVAVASLSPLSAERIDSLCREAIESAVVTMFGWSTGDFSFDVRTESEPSDPELLLPTGLNAQYLAMEGARVSDEAGSQDDSAGSEDPEVSPGFDEMSAHDIFGVAEQEGPPEAAADAPEACTADPVETLAVAAVERVDAAAERERDGSVDVELIAAEVAADETLVELSHGDRIDEEEPRGGLSGSIEASVPALGDETEVALPEEMPLAETEPVEAPSAAGQVIERALVALDDDLVALEWVKEAVKDSFPQVHIFQHTDRALDRIRQYILRGQPPVILVSPEMTVDPLGGIRDVADFVSRLKGQSNRLTALWLREDGADPVHRLGPADGAVTRPERNRLRLVQAPDQLQRVAASFRAEILAVLSTVDSGGPAAAPASGSEVSPDTLRRLRDATRSLTEASSRGEILPLVIRFAAEIFTRVAMFMVRDGIAVGMAQKRLSHCQGPDDLALREMRFEVGDSAWMTAVLENGKPVDQPPSNDGDRALALLLGDRVPARAYLAPIESSGRVIGLLYGDNLPDDAPIGDTSSLEVVLHHAGLALDRAALERALHEGDG